jgi:16S rRNA processing protein RimM
VRLHLSGIDSREQTLPWLGAAVLVPPECLQALPEGEFYWRDLIGLEARAPDGERLGRVAEIVPTGGADVLVIRREGRRDLLLPVVREWIARVERERG